MTKTKFEAMDILNEYDIPCGPILSMKELLEDQSLRATGTIVEVDHPERGKYFSVGNPIKLSDSPSEVTRSPLLGEHTDEILREVLGFNDKQVAEIHDSGELDAPHRAAAEEGLHEDFLARPPLYPRGLSLSDDASGTTLHCSMKIRHIWHLV